MRIFQSFSLYFRCIKVKLQPALFNPSISTIQKNTDASHFRNTAANE